MPCCFHQLRQKGCKTFWFHHQGESANGAIVFFAKKILCPLHKLSFQFHLTRVYSKCPGYRIKCGIQLHEKNTFELYFTFQLISPHQGLAEVYCMLKANLCFCRLHSRKLSVCSALFSHERATNPEPYGQCSRTWVTKLVKVRFYFPFH